MSQFIGFAFPFQKSATAFPAIATDDDLIKQSLIQLLLTGRGERIMRPDVGSGAYATIFESETDVLIANLQHEVANTIGRFEPRVILQNVTVVRGDPNDPTTPDTAVTVTIEYLVISTAKMQSLTLTLGGP